MNPTNEQIDAMHEGATKERLNRDAAMRAALDELCKACAGCWMREHGGCEQARCSVWRMMQPYDQIRRMRARGKLDAWDWYAEAKNADRLLFVDAEPDATTTNTTTKEN